MLRPINVELPFLITDVNWKCLTLVQDFVVRWLVRLLLRYNLVICALLTVTRLAGRTDVEPVGFTTMRAWNNVVQRKLRQLDLALCFLASPSRLQLAGKVVPKIHVITAVLQCLAPLDLLSHDNNGRNLHLHVLGSYGPIVVGL